MTVIWTGRIIAISTRTNATSRPRQRSRESAYATGMLETSTPIVAGSLLQTLLGAAGALVSNTDSLQEYEQQSETYAVFARASWHISESLRANDRS